MLLGTGFYLEIVLSLKGDSICLALMVLSLDSDFYFSSLNLSLTSLNRIILRWLLFLFRRSRINCFVWPPSSTLLHRGCSFRYETSGLVFLLVEGLSVMLSLREKKHLSDFLRRISPRTCLSSSMTPSMTFSSLGRLRTIDFC